MATTPSEPPRREPPGTAASGRDRGDRPRRRRRLVPLPLGIRVTLFLVGWILVLVGVAGLVLPGIQGVLTILLGATLLSLVSELVYEWMRALLHRWPGLWRRLEGLRLKLHRRFRRRKR